MHAWQSYDNCLYILIQLHNRQHRNSVSSARPHSKEHVRKQACGLYQMPREGHSGILPCKQSRCCQVKWSFSWSRGRFVFLCARSPCVYMSVCVLVLFLLLLCLDIACLPLTSAKACHFEWYLKYYYWPLFSFNTANKSVLKDENGFKSKIKLRIAPKLADDIVSGDIGSGLEVEVEKTLKTLWAMVDYYIWSETKFQDWVHEKRDAQVAFFSTILTLACRYLCRTLPCLRYICFLCLSTSCSFR